MIGSSTNRKRILGKVLIAMLMIFLGCKFVSAQEANIQQNMEFPDSPNLQNDLSASKIKDVRNKSKAVFESFIEDKTLEILHEKDTEIFEEIETIEFREIALKTEYRKWNEEENITKEENSALILPHKKPDFAKYKQSKEKEKFHWKPAMIQSFYFLGIQHSFRMLQKKTRRELNGKFFKEWGKSARNLGGWRDGDGFFTNYIAHPMQGVVTGRIFINNSDASKKLEFGKSKEYWTSRLKVMAWSAAWSTQFELGPISEASIGNVGLYDDVAPNRMGWVDLVVTPTVGTATLIGEDMIDKFILKKWLERKSKSHTKIKLLRTFLTPFQSFTNVLRGKAPWKRDNR